MQTRWLLTTSALVLGIAGVALSFLPREVLAFAGAQASGPPVLLAQLAGAMALAWAVLNWMSRGQRVGGIYARPLALANTLHFVMGALTLLTPSMAGGSGAPATWLLIPYAGLAVWWLATLFTSPV